MIYFDLDYEVELSGPESKISSITKTHAKADLVEQAVNAVVDYLAEDCAFDASYFDNAEILKYCKLLYSDADNSTRYNTYYGDAYVTFVYLRCYFDDDKFLREHI